MATPLRWACLTAVLALAVALVREAFLVIAHSPPSLASSAELLAIATLPLGVVVFAILRAEESRLSSELRTARTGSPVLRAMTAQRREGAPLVSRMFATRLGVAAVLLADGDTAGARHEAGEASPFAQGGRLDRLRAIVDADLERATGGPAGLERCIKALRELPRIGHREADLYRMHVVVKAVLEHGATDTALDLAAELAVSSDPDERLYATWLRAWFDLDAAASDVAWPPLGEGDLRLATLMARAHGAESLVAELESRLATIAHPAREG
ncbi:MAG: hypothetical protein ACLP1X_33255 [Polyangiaceae bacterium]